MEHECTKCGWKSFSNNLGPIKCPKCDSPVIHTFDEDTGDQPNFKITGEQE